MKVKIFPLLLCLLLLFSLASCKKSPDEGDTTEPKSEFSGTDNIHIGEEETLDIDNIDFAADFGGIKVINSVNITGKFNEDGSGREVSDVSGLVIYNDTEQTLQYIKFTAEYSDGKVYTYSASTVPAGATCDIAEENASPYRALEDEMPKWNLENIVFFDDEPSFLEDKIEISGSDGILTVANISSEDITDNIVIYYKDYNNEEGYLSSGITYRVNIRGGLAAGSVRQAAAQHYTLKGSMIMFAELLPAETDTVR